jgi:hypothetical protein
MGIFNQFLRRTASVPRTEMRYTHFPTPWNEQCSSQRYPPPTLRRTASVPRTEMRYTHFPTPWNEQCSSQRVSPSRLYD